MKNLVQVVIVAASLCGAIVPVQAGEVFTVVADSTLSENDGFVLQIVADNGEGQSLFTFEEAGKWRIYAFRAFGSDTWDLQPTPQYLTPTQTMDSGDTWDFIDEDNGDPMSAEVVDRVSVTVLAGTFDAYMVDITNLNQPSEIVETIWFVDGVGFVKNVGYVFGGGGVIDWQDELSDYDIVGGSGFMPMAVGNTWSFVDTTVPTEDQSWGKLKSEF